MFFLLLIIIAFISHYYDVRRLNNNYYFFPEDFSRNLHLSDDLRRFSLAEQLRLWPRTVTAARVWNFFSFVKFRWPRLFASSGHERVRGGNTRRLRG